MTPSRDDHRNFHRVSGAWHKSVSELQSLECKEPYGNRRNGTYQPCWAHALLVEGAFLLVAQSRLGDKPFKFRVVCPRNGTAFPDTPREVIFASVAISGAPKRRMARSTLHLTPEGTHTP